MNGQSGQALVVFAIIAVFIVGAVALAVDFGFVVTQHRNLQGFADQAAIAGAQQLTPSGMSSQVADTQAAARKAAFIYLRDNLLCSGQPASSCAGSTALSATALGTACPPPAGVTMWYADVQGCQMPAPLSGYTLTICTPGAISASGTCAGGLSAGQPANSLSVLVTESVATSLARIVGAGGATAGGFADAQFTYQPGAPNGKLPYALYSLGCVATGNKPEIVAGDVYIDSCGISPQSSAASGFCAERTLGSAGNIVYGPSAPPPPVSYLSNQTLANCQGVAGGVVVSTGQISQLPPGAGVRPQYTPPPGYNAVSPWQSASAATPNADCTNGEVAADGSALVKACFSPGVYTTITGIANNLNPGVYYVLGDPACDVGSAACTGVQFSGNTMNANWSNVADTCWAPPNSVSSGTFVSPCPSGFAFDPTLVSDPMCPVGAPAGYLTPAFTLTPVVDLTGSLDNPPAGGGTLYYVRVSAYLPSNPLNLSFTGFGETATAEQTVLVNGSLGQHGINVSITPQVGARYEIYISTTPGAEVLWGDTSGSSPQLVDRLGTGHAYPRFDTSRCHGFHDIPKWPGDAGQNHGVTFVLYNKAQFCVGTCGGGGVTPTVLLSPYCGGYARNPAVDCPYATSGPNINDGAFAIYSTSGGAILGEGSGTRLGVSGAIYAPSAAIDFDDGAQIEVLPGQVIAGSVNLHSGNALSPIIDFPYGQGVSGVGPILAPLVTLIH